MPGKAHFVGDHQHGAAFFGQRAHHPQYLANQFRVERRGGFVEQHYLRVHRQCAGDCDPLLLPAGQVRRVVVLTLVQADLVQQGFGLFDAFGAWAFEHAHRAFNHVLQHRHVRPQVEALKHHAQATAHALDLTVVARRLTAVDMLFHLDHFTVDADDALIGGFQQVDTAQERTFTGPAGAEDRDHVAFVCVQINTLEDMGAAEGLLDVSDRQG